MTCYRPLDAEAHGFHPSGKQKLIFKNHPEFKNHPNPLKLPCGKCIGCKLDHSQMWAIRIMHHVQMNEETQFITLTYDPKHLPWDGSLTPPHFTKFMKRLRQHCPKEITYYHAGEYGDQLTRPHHHAIIFNHAFNDLDLVSEKEGIPLYTSPTLAKLWGKGYVTIGETNIHTAAYIARYTLKKQYNEEYYETTDETTGEILKLQPPYTTMSNGIGKSWYDLYQSDVFPSDTVIHKGRTIKTPRYYETQLQRTNADLLQTIKARRLSNSLKHAKDQTPERLAVREKVKILTTQSLKRKLHET